MAIAPAYPVTLAVDYPEQQSRWKTLLRLFLAIPLAIFAYLLSSGVVLAVWAAILVRGRIPRWLFDFQVGCNRWVVRAESYFLLLTDQYPPFEGEYPISYEVQYPERLSRWKLVIWKFITSLPHMLVLFFLSIGAFFVVIFAWFAILITGRFPRGLHSYVAGVIRWGVRVNAYFLSLTDEYPPMSLSPDAGPASREMYMLSSIGGWLLGAGLVALAVTAVLVGRETETVHVSYDELVAGRVGGSETTVDIWGMHVSLTGAVDPADEDFSLLVPEQGRRLVAFRLEFSNDSGRGKKVRESDFRLRDSDGEWHDPLLVFVGGHGAPVTVGKHTAAEAIVVFEIADDARPDELRYRPGFVDRERVVEYQFE